MTRGHGGREPSFRTPAPAALPKSAAVVRASEYQRRRGRHRCRRRDFGREYRRQRSLHRDRRGTSFNVTGELDVGVGGEGLLTIANQATVASGNNAAAPSQGFDVGEFSGGSGEVIVNGSESLLAQHWPPSLSAMAAWATCRSTPAPRSPHPRPAPVPVGIDYRQHRGGLRFLRERVRRRLRTCRSPAR